MQIAIRKEIHTENIWWILSLNGSHHQMEEMKKRLNGEDLYMFLNSKWYSVAMHACLKIMNMTLIICNNMRLINDSIIRYILDPEDNIIRILMLIHHWNWKEKLWSCPWTMMSGANGSMFKNHKRWIFS